MIKAFHERRPCNSCFPTDGLEKNCYCLNPSLILYKYENINTYPFVSNFIRMVDHFYSPLEHLLDTICKHFNFFFFKKKKKKPMLVWIPPLFHSRFLKNKII